MTDQEFYNAKPAQHDGGARKLDAGKPPVYQGVLARFPLALHAIAWVSVFGAKKYDAPIASRAFTEVPNGESRYKDALVRHLLDDVQGVVNHQDGGVLHMAQAAWDAMAALETYLKDLGGYVP